MELCELMVFNRRTLRQSETTYIYNLYVYLYIYIYIYVMYFVHIVGEQQ